MAKTRIFLGWDEPVTDTVCRHLIPDPVPRPLDMTGTVIVVPTAQAGRRLKEALIRYCARHDSSIIGMTVVTPTFFIRPATGPARVASPTAVRAAWCRVLAALKTGECGTLIPSLPDPPDHRWALTMADMIQSLRNALADGGLTIADVLVQCAENFPERDRWRDLARLEKSYLAEMARNGDSDPCSLELDVADTPRVPDECRRVVMAAVPDPSLLALKVLEQLGQTLSIEILIPAPRSLADHFDDWGCPISERWMAQTIDLDDSQLFLAANPREQARQVVSIVTRHASAHGPSDVAMGVPDADAIPALREEFEPGNLSMFDPAGRPVTGHPLGNLVAIACDFLDSHSYDAFGRLMRHPDIRRWLAEKTGHPGSSVIEELDVFQNIHLPATWEDIAAHFKAAVYTGPDWRSIYSALGAAVELFGRELAIVEKSDNAAAGLRHLFAAIYAGRAVGITPEDRLFADVADKIDSAITEIDALVRPGVFRDQLALFARRIAELTYDLPRPAVAIDLEGWLELAWNDAPVMIVTGMNDGIVPDSRLADAFVPDSLRRRLKLRDDARRHARDAYLLSLLRETRRAAGGLFLVAIKNRSNGDPLRPSRLLFQCTDATLPARVRTLFGTSITTAPRFPPTLSFKLDPAPPHDIAPADLVVDSLSVTTFRAYLQCPFRFYLSHILGMEAVDDHARELDGGAFGEMVHSALHALAADGKLSRSDDEKAVASMLKRHVDKWLNARFGNRLPLPVELALESARARLSQAAHIITQGVADGWTVSQFEASFTMPCAGITVKGRIDRIERHLDGRIRIIDFKTSDKRVSPVDAHLGRAGNVDDDDYRLVKLDSVRKLWRDLQLPLYRMLFEHAAGAAGGSTPSSIGLGYVNLPKNADNAELELWDDFTDDLYSAARATVTEVVRRICKRKFWPPAARVDYDDFEEFLKWPANDYLAQKRFEEFMHQAS